MALDLTSFDAALKQHYTTEMIHNMVYKDNPFFALVKKREDFGGRNLPIPLIYGNPQGRSATFGTAQTRGAAVSSRLEDFLLTRVSDYSIATIDNQTLEASKGNANAFMEAATVEIDGAINSLSRSIAVDLYRQGFGARGRIGAIAGSVITVSDTGIAAGTTESITNFEVDMQLVAASTEGASTLRGAPDIVTIAGVDRSLGTITLSAAVPGTYVVGDFLFVNGDRQNSATPTRIKLSGLEAWDPGTSPTATAFFGVDRTLDVTRLGGQRLSIAASPIEEGLIDGAVRVAREGGKVDHCFLSYRRYADLEKALSTKVRYVDLKVSADIAFRGIMLNGPRGPIKVIPDQNCPHDRAFMLQLDTWVFYSLGKAVRVIDTDGLQMLRQASSDGVEVRYGFYGNLGCRAPGYNINLQF